MTILRMLKSVRGQQLSEYAIVVGVVIAAAVAMQGPVRNRLQRVIQDKADGYVTAAGGAAGALETTLTQDSESESTADMDRAGLGTINSASGSAQDISW